VRGGSHAGVAGRPKTAIGAERRDPERDPGLAARRRQPLSRLIRAAVVDDQDFDRGVLGRVALGLRHD